MDHRNVEVYVTLTLTLTLAEFRSAVSSLNYRCLLYLFHGGMV